MVRHLPNLLSTLRLLAAPFAAWLIITDHDTAALLVFAAAGLSDGLDGFIARRWGFTSDFGAWLEKLAPADPGYQHHQTGEDNADAHLKRTIMGHQVVLPITGGTLDLGPWEQVFYAEFDGQRKKRVIVKVMGE